MLTLYVCNLSGLKPVSDYEYVVMANAEKIAEGKIKKHKRADGWAVLAKRIAEDNLEKDKSERD